MLINFVPTSVDVLAEIHFAILHNYVKGSVLILEDFFSVYDVGVVELFEHFVLFFIVGKIFVKSDFLDSIRWAVVDSAETSLSYLVVKNILCFRFSAIDPAHFSTLIKYIIVYYKQISNLLFSMLSHNGIASFAAAQKTQVDSKD